MTVTFNLSFFKNSLRLVSNNALSGALSWLNAIIVLSDMTIAHTPMGFLLLLTITSYKADNSPFAASTLIVPYHIPYVAVI